MPRLTANLNETTPGLDDNIVRAVAAHLKALGRSEEEATAMAQANLEGARALVLSTSEENGGRVKGAGKGFTALKDFAATL
jgi:hypothetical protein